MSVHRVAILPMRAGSARIPDKNIRDCAGQPLYQYVLKMLLNCPLIHQVCVDTDCPVIAEYTNESGYGSDRLLLLERPEHLRAGHVSMNDVLLHTTSKVPADLYLQTHATNPLLKSDTVQQAIRSLESSSQHDSLFSVTAWQKRFYDEQQHPVNHDPSVLLPTQELPVYYEENSCIYLFTRDSLMNKGRRIGESPMLFPMNAIESIDIDGWDEFRLAECAIQAGIGDTMEEDD